MMTERDWIGKGLRDAGDTFLETARTCDRAINEAALALVRCLEGGGKLLLCGNGGSAADAQHIAAEMSVKMKLVRAPMAAIALTTNSSLLTAQANDLGFETVFSRQVESLGRKGDLLLAISTSGDSPNILEAVESAKRMGITVIGLTGKDGGRLAPASDIAVVVPSNDVPRIQEVHIAVGHLLCEYAESCLHG
jgi:D-sedoheptulose 7-phosphate isomerase